MSKRARRLALIILCLSALVLLCDCGAADTADTDAAEAADTTETTDATETTDSTDTADATETTDAADTADATDADEAADTADSYTVIFDSRGGTEVAPFTAPAGSPLHLGANPTKEGSAFVTWEDQWGMPIGHGAENTDVEWDTEPGQEITLYAYTAEGVFRYEPGADENRLVCLKREDLRASAGFMQPFIATAPLILIYVVDMDKMRIPGGDPTAAARFAAVDCGFVGQNVYLHAASEGLHSCFIGRVDAEHVGPVLGLSESQIPLFAQVVGRPAASAEAKE